MRLLEVILALSVLACWLVLAPSGWLEWLMCKVLPHRDIQRDGSLYLRRFYLTPRSWRRRLFLHHIVLADPDPYVHDHPWPFRTLVLRGGYNEDVMSDCRCCNLPVDWNDGELLAGTGCYRPARYRHRIFYVRPGTWTLVLAGRAEREWGFWVPGRVGTMPNLLSWVPWHEYLGVKNETAEEDVIR